MCLILEAVSEFISLEHWDFDVCLCELYTIKIVLEIVFIAANTRPVCDSSECRGSAAGAVRDEGVPRSSQSCISLPAAEGDEQVDSFSLLSALCL